MSIDDFALTLKNFSTTRTAAVIGIIAAVIGPVALIAFGGGVTSNVPRYVWVLSIIVLVTVIGWGYHLFTRTHDAKDMSISPKSRQG